MFALSPELSAVVIADDDVSLEGGYEGRYDVADRAIWISEAAAAGGAARLGSVMLHEIGHAVDYSVCGDGGRCSDGGFASAYVGTRWDEEGLPAHEAFAELLSLTPWLVESYGAGADCGGQTSPLLQQAALALGGRVVTPEWTHAPRPSAFEVALPPGQESAIDAPFVYVWQPGVAPGGFLGTGLSGLFDVDQVSYALGLVNTGLERELALVINAGGMTYTPDGVRIAEAATQYARELLPFGRELLLAATMLHGGDVVATVGLNGNLAYLGEALVPYYAIRFTPSRPDEISILAVSCAVPRFGLTNHPTLILPSPGEYSDGNPRTSESPPDVWIATRDVDALRLIPVWDDETAGLPKYETQRIVWDEATVLQLWEDAGRPNPTDEAVVLPYPLAEESVAR